jgi:hypothetical protein
MIADHPNGYSSMELTDRDFRGDLPVGVAMVDEFRAVICVYKPTMTTPGSPCV